MYYISCTCHLIQAFRCKSVATFLVTAVPITVDRVFVYSFLLHLRRDQQVLGSRGRFPSSKSPSRPKIRRQRFPRVLLCFNRPIMFRFSLLDSMGIAWLVDVKKLFIPLLLQTTACHEIYDIGTRLSMKTAMSSCSCAAGELFAPMPESTLLGPAPPSTAAETRHSSPRQLAFIANSFYCQYDCYKCTKP